MLLLRGRIRRMGLCIGVARRCRAGRLRRSGGVDGVGTTGVTGGRSGSCYRVWLATCIWRWSRRLLLLLLWMRRLRLLGRGRGPARSLCRRVRLLRRWCWLLRSGVRSRDWRGGLRLNRRRGGHRGRLWWRSGRVRGVIRRRRCVLLLWCSRRLLWSCAGRAPSVVLSLCHPSSYRLDLGYLTPIALEKDTRPQAATTNGLIPPTLGDSGSAVDAVGARRRPLAPTHAPRSASRAPRPFRARASGSHRH